MFNVKFDISKQFTCICSMTQAKDVQITNHFLAKFVIIFNAKYCREGQCNLCCQCCAQYIIIDIIQIINIANYMTAEPEKLQKNVLIRAFQCKNRSKISIQQFLSIVYTQPKLDKLSEKGLYIVYLSEIMLKAFIIYDARIKTFILQLANKQVKKKQIREGGQARRRRKNKKNQKKRGQGKTLQQLSNQSVSNPSNVQKPRANTEKVDSANQKDLLSKQKEEESNGSKQNSSKNQLKIELNKITEQLKGQQQTHFGDIDFLPFTSLQENSQTSSSQQSGQISNLSEKLKLFTNIKQVERRGTTTRRKTGNNEMISRGTKTKKKKYQIFDQSTLIQQTRATDNEVTVNYTEVSRFQEKQALDFDLIKNFIKNLGHTEKSQYSHIFNQQKISLMRSIIQDDNLMHQNGTKMNQNEMMISDQNYDMTIPDYTMSQPTSAPFYQPDFFKQSLQIKDTQFQFRELAKKSSKDQATLFYQLLWRQQNEELELYQKNPEKFSPIIIRHK